MSCCYLLRFFFAPSMHVGGSEAAHIWYCIYQVLQNYTVLMKNGDTISKEVNKLMVWFSSIATKKHHLTNHQINQAVKNTLANQSAGLGLTSLRCACQRYHYPLPGITRRKDEVLLRFILLVYKAAHSENNKSSIPPFEASERI